MSIAIEWSAFALGLLAGALGGALFFAGLAISIRLALGQRHAIALLLASAAVRIALLTGSAAFIASAGGSAFTGFAAAFMLIRLAVLAAARAPQRDGGPQWI